MEILRRLPRFSTGSGDSELALLRTLSDAQEPSGMDISAGRPVLAGRDWKLPETGSEGDNLFQYFQDRLTFSCVHA